MPTLVGLKRHAKAVSEQWPRSVKVGGTAVKVYRRRRSDGAFAFEVGDCSTGKRRLRSFADSDKALSEAARPARLLAAGEANAAQVNGRDLADVGNTRDSIAS
jgi:hypothetical protein